MINSIERVFRDAGVAPDTVSWADRHWGGDMYHKAEAVGLLRMYEFGFRTASHAVHGTWSDIRLHHVSLQADRYCPEPHYSRARPEIVEAASVLCLWTAEEYVQAVVGNAGEELAGKLRELSDWFTRMGELHERWQIAQEACPAE
jgi:hypothetical protein